MPICNFKPIEAAQVETKNQSLFSEKFDDIYFKPEHGLAETEHVFLNGNRLRERFAALNDDESFVIAETGFGTGLNFLAAWHLFEQHAPQSAKLIFISLEKYPLPPQQLSSLKTHFPEIETHINALVDAYPEFSPGLHCCPINSQVTLQLFYGDIELALEQMAFQADAWFLDGFTPAKNQAMWQSSVFKQLRKKSKCNSSIATFTAAGFVRRGLEEAGFEMSKAKGFMNKREMLVGTYTKSAPLELPAKEKPWFESSQTAQSGKIKRIAIIGAGLAGCSSAYYLSQAGFDVTVFEKESAIAKGTSKNKAGILHTSFSHSISNQSHYYWQSYLFALKELKSIVPEWQPSGIIYLSKNAAEAKSFDKALSSGFYPESLWQSLNPSELEAQYSLHADAGILLEQSGHLEPQKLCQRFLELTAATVHTSTEIIAASFEPEQQLWQLTDQHQQQHQFDGIILANAKAANAFIPESILPLKSLRGQISLADQKHFQQPPRINLCGEGYVTPAVDGQIPFGASYNLNDPNPEATTDDHIDNIDKLNRLLGNTNDQNKQQLFNTDTLKPEHLEAQVGFRCHTNDYFPVVGPVPNAEEFLNAYDNIRFGRFRQPFTTGHFQPNLFVNLALGSRGLTQCFINAKLLQCQLRNLPLPIEYDIVNSMHPARFLYRKLKRNEVTIDE